MDRCRRPLNVMAALVIALAAAGEAGARSLRYRAIQETEHGKAFVAERSDARSVEQALRLTLADAAGYFGAQPRVSRAWRDAKGGSSGGAAFTIDAQGTALRGLVTCTVGKKVAHVAVALIRADAPAGEWQKLVAPEAAKMQASSREAAKTQQAPEQGAAVSEGAAASGGAVASGGVPAPANVPLQRHLFDDRVASIGLAEGWTTPTREAMQGARIVGPEGQVLSIGLSLGVQTPGTPLSRMPGAVVAAFTTPAQVLAAISPQLSRRSAMQGGPESRLEEISVIGDQPAALPGGRAQVVRYGVSERAGGRVTHYRALANVAITPTAAGGFMFGITELRAPDALFDRDAPVMLQMLQSVQYDDAEIRRRSGQQLKRQQDWFAHQQADQRAREAANDAQHQRYWQAQSGRAQQSRAFDDGQLAQQRHYDDYSELMRGYRTVEDTETGERRTADFLNVDKIVEELNEREPGRYRDIPLRDELHPLDGQ